PAHRMAALGVAPDSRSEFGVRARTGMALRCCLILLLLTTGCASLPSLESRSESHALQATSGPRLGRATQPRAAEHPGDSGVHPLPDSRDAFAARVLLARAAERSLDVQYYIWHKDLSGTLLMNELLAAADRGVRVRLLLDDHGTPDMDRELAALD